MMSDTEALSCTLAKCCFTETPEASRHEVWCSYRQIVALRERIAELLEQDAAKDDSMLVLEHRISELEAQLADKEGWQSIETAPMDGRMAFVFRPLAAMSHDQPVALKRLIGGNKHCWESTVPAGQSPFNPTDGCCHVTHWMPLPTALLAPPNRRE